MGRKESNQTNKQTNKADVHVIISEWAFITDQNPYLLVHSFDNSLMILTV